MPGLDPGILHTTNSHHRPPVADRIKSGHDGESILNIFTTSNSTRPAGAGRCEDSMPREE